MSKLRYNFVFLAFIGAGLLTATGCESTDKGQSAPLTRAEETPAPAPAPAPSQAPAPARSTAQQSAAPAGYVRYSLFFPSGVRDSSQLMLERVSPSKVSVGQTYDSTLMATNISSNTLNDVMVMDECSTHFKLASSEPPATVQKTGSMSWSLGSIGPNETKRIVVHGSATSLGDVQNCMNATFTPAICITTLVVAPKLGLTAVATVEAMRCDPIVIKYTVSNPGTGSAQNVVIQDTLPAGLTTAEGTGSIVANVGLLESGQSKTYTMNLKATKTGKYTHSATATADDGLKAEASTATQIREPVLSIKETGPETMYIGRTGTYVITVGNTGDGDAVNSVVENSVPANSKVLSAEGGVVNADKITWNLGTLKAGGTKSLTYVLQADQPGTIASTAAYRADCGARVTAPISTEVRGIPAMLLEMVDIEDPVEVGKNAVYMITITNQGSSTGTNIVVNCKLEPTMQFVSTSGVTKGTNDGMDVSFATLPTLAPKAKAVWYVTVKAIKDGDVRFTTTLKTDQLGREVMKTESTHYYK